MARVVVEAAGPVAGVISKVVRLRCAVEVVAGDILHDANRLGAGHRLFSADSYARNGRAAQTTGGRSAAWRWAVSMLPTARSSRSCNPRRAHSGEAV